MLVHIESVKVIDVRIPFSRPRGSAVDPAFAKTACLVITRGGGHLGFAEAPVFAAPTYDEQFVAQTHAAIELFASAMLAKGRRDGSAVAMANETCKKWGWDYSWFAPFQNVEKSEARMPHERYLQLSWWW